MDIRSKIANATYKGASDRLASYIPADLLPQISHPFNEPRGSGKHDGIDIKAPAGKVVYSTGAGVVTTGNRGKCGKFVQIAHDDGIVSIYCHLSSILVSSGQMVSLGQPVGKVGATGSATDAQGKAHPHLHYALMKDGVKLNPVDHPYGHDYRTVFTPIEKISSAVNAALTDKQGGAEGLFNTLMSEGKELFRSSNK